MLDITLFREAKDLIKASEKKRGRDISNVDKVILYDKKWRYTLKKMEALKHERNVVSMEINKLKKQGKQIAGQVRHVKSLLKELKRTETAANTFKQKREQFRKLVGNLLDKSVPKGKDDKDNVEIKQVGKPRKSAKKSHLDILKKLDLLDLDSAATAAGAGFFYLKDELAILNIALTRFTLDFLMKRGFRFIFPPFMLNKKAMEGGVSKDEFSHMVYKIEGEDLYLIGTAEHSILAMYIGKTFDKKELPILMCGFSTNFRKEGGSHGKYTKGLFRTHQFDKVEQFVFCAPEDDEKFFQLLQKNAEDLYKQLEIPFRVVNTSSGDLSLKNAKMWDIEAYMADGEYREIGSCSTCTTYQAETLNIKFKDKNRKGYIHTLNNTAIATSRTMIALIENHQQKDGSIKIPKALWPYTGFKEIKKR